MDSADGREGRPVQVEGGAADGACFPITVFHRFPLSAIGGVGLIAEKENESASVDSNTGGESVYRFQLSPIGNPSRFSNHDAYDPTLIIIIYSLSTAAAIRTFVYFNHADMGTYTDVRAI